MPTMTLDEIVQYAQQIRDEGYPEFVDVSLCGEAGGGVIASAGEMMGLHIRSSLVLAHASGIRYGSWISDPQLLPDDVVKLWVREVFENAAGAMSDDDRNHLEYQ